LMNVISKSDVFAENKLFATLDTTVRKVVIGNLPFLLSDTVGFIRKLPTQLVDSFKSTLDEVREADLLLQSMDKPTLMVFNKIDAYIPEDYDEEDLMVERTGAHYTLVRKKVYDRVREIHVTRFPYNKFLYPSYEEQVGTSDDTI